MRPAEPASAARITAVAMRLIDERGPGISLRSIAAELGVTKSTIAWHVGNRQALLGLVGSAWMETLVPPGGAGGSLRWLATMAHAYRDAARRQPHMARLVTAGLGAGTGMLTLPAVVIERLERSGLDRRELAQAYNAVMTVVVGFVAIELGHEPVTPGGSAQVDAVRHPAIARNLDVLEGRAFGLHAGAEPGALDGSFDYVVELLVGGLARRVDAGR
jgi:AcrR family transcriptional regulator